MGITDKPTITGSEYVVNTYKRAPLSPILSPCSTFQRPLISGVDSIIAPFAMGTLAQGTTCNSLPCIAIAGTPITYIDTYSEPSFATPPICTMPNRPIGERGKESIVAIPAEILPEPFFAVNIHNTLPSRQTLKLGRLYFTKDQTSPDFLLLHRTYSNTTRRTKRTLSMADVHTQVAAMSYRDSVPYMPTISIMETYLENVHRNTFVMVADATGDPTVEYGAALYFYKADTDEVFKTSEMPDASGPLYTKVAGIPTATTENIQLTVTARHQHDDQDLLETLTLQGGRIVSGRTILEKSASYVVVEW